MWIMLIETALPLNNNSLYCNLGIFNFFLLEYLFLTVSSKVVMAAATKSKIVVAKIQYHFFGDIERGSRSSVTLERGSTRFKLKTRNQLIA